MRFTYAESMCEPHQYAALAREAEEHGFDSFAVPESICYPEHSDSQYPYTDDGDREFLSGRPFIDPFVLMATLGAVTQRIRFTTFVIKLPMRHPVLAAKQATSVAYMTRNRLALGVGLSPWPDDFKTLDVPWERRGKRLDEAIEIVRGLSTGEYFGYDGEHYAFDPVRLSPAPSRPIPILIGGHSDAALRRAARIGDGWMHGGGGKAQDLDGALDRLHALRVEAGREHDPFEIHVISLDAFTIDGIHRLEDRGVTDVIVGFRNAYEPDTTPLVDKVRAIRSYAEGIIAKL